MPFSLVTLNTNRLEVSAQTNYQTNKLKVFLDFGISKNLFLDALGQRVLTEEYVLAKHDKSIGSSKWCINPERNEGKSQQTPLHSLPGNREEGPCQLPIGKVSTLNKFSK